MKEILKCLRSIMRIFRKSKKVEPEVSNLYVVNAGSYGGDYLVLMEVNSLSYTFLVLPDMIKRIIEKDVFLNGLEKKVVKFMEKLPNYVYKTCKSQYNSINTNDGLRKTN